MNQPKRYLITAALPYANGQKHIGHLAGAYLPADIYVRYLKAQKRDVVFVCGSDEHGTAIPIQATKEGTTARAIIDKYHPLMEQNFKDLGIAFDVYHLWWDPDLEAQTTRTVDANRLFAYHVCDWMTPTTDLLNDRGLMGEGCIDLRGIRAMVEHGGFNGMIEVEVFSNRWWDKKPGEFLEAIQQAYLQHT